jgi:hypothetical protein
MKPSDVARNRTARLTREARTPVYSTTTPTAAEARARAVAEAEVLACTADFCHVCGRCTDHFAEHTPDQILAWAKKPGLLQTLLSK